MPRSPSLRATASRIPAAFAAALTLALAGVGPTGAQMPRAVDPPRPVGWVGGPGSANVELAARWAPYKLSDLVHSTSVSPRWIEGTERFWYEYETSAGSFHWVVDPVAGTKRALFDRDRIAAEITRITGDPYEARHLPIRSIRFVDAGTVRFEVESSQDEEIEEQADTTEVEEQQEERRPARPRTRKKIHYFEYDVATQTLTELDEALHPDNHPSWASVSPDGAWVVFGRNHDLWMMSGADYARILDVRRGKSGEEADSLDQEVEVDEIRLTDDGVEHYGWYNEGRGDTDDEREEAKDERKRAPLSWSKDSRRFALVRSDQREVDELWVIHSTGNDRPQLETYKYDMPGEENVTQNEIWIYDLEARAAVKVEDDPWKDQSMAVLTDDRFVYPDSDEPRRSLWLADGSDELWFERVSRDRHRVDVMVADASTGAMLRTVVEERMNTYMETRDPVMLADGDVIWWSERDGWAHLYRYGSDGTLKARLTEGPFSVQSIEGVDEASGTVFFMAAGREADEDPYYQHLYRVGLDGSGLRILNPGDHDSRVSGNESRRFFVENASRVNTVPASRVRNARGEVVVELEEADFSQLLAAGYRFPEPFTVKADDGVTDLYGVLYKPFDFDSTRVYPLVQYVYPGPQTESVAKAFSTSSNEVALAQFGMIVMTVGNRGGHPSRSKWYHNYGYGDLRDYGLADKKAAAEQLADRHDFIDLNRVGIYGHSGGGFMSTAAMLVYPDFFKVAVSSAGNHQNDIYNRWWSETHHGVEEVVDDEGEVTFEYDIDGNAELAANLKGRLLLTTGDIDNNVHPANTYRMAEALIQAGKRFDFFIFPGQRHGFGSMNDYWFWLRAEYFVRHLLGDPTWEVDLTPLQGDRPRTR